MDDYSDFDTSGYEDFETGAALRLPTNSLNASALRSAAATKISPTIARLARQPGTARALASAMQGRVTPASASQLARGLAASTGVSEARAREIVAEELAALLEAGVIGGGQMVPWSGMPSRRGPRDESMWPLGLGLATFGPASVGTQFLTVSPQRPFRGERLVLEVRRYGVAATVEPPTVLIDEFRVGDIPQRLGGGSLPASVFQPDAQGVRLSLDATVPGVLIEVGIRLDQNTLASGDGIVVSGAIIGRSVDGWRG